MEDAVLRNLYKTLLEKVNGGNAGVMLTYLNFRDKRNGAVENKLILTGEQIEKKEYPLAAEVYDKIYLALESGMLQMTETEKDKAVLIEPFMPKPRLIVFGGGHIAVPVVELGARVGFSVTIIDDRPAFANRNRFPNGDHVICESFEKSFGIFTSGASVSSISMTSPQTSQIKCGWGSVFASKRS
jgi:xanthine dehydrogenase accessory factor